MIPASTHYELRTFGEGVVGKCTMTNVSHMQQLVLTMGYQDKLVFVRELIHNAVDSMLRAEKAAEPITIHFPNEMDSVFWVRDYGTGMSHQLFIEVYSDLGMSDKRDEAISTGALGIGSKSPLVYTDAFNVQCFDGKCVRTYVIGWGSDGCVTYQAHPSVPSDEPQGVLVAVPIKEADMENTVARIRSVCDRLNHPHAKSVAVPNFVGDADAALCQQENLSDYARDDRGMPLSGQWDGYAAVTPYVWLRYDDPDNRVNSMFRLRRDVPFFGAIDVYMGRVVYKLDLHQLVLDLPEEQQRSLDLLGMLPSGMRVCIPSDASDGRCPVTFDAGRERLQLSAATVAWIYPVLLDATNEVEKYYRNLFADAITHADRLRVITRHNFSSRAVKRVLRLLPSIEGVPTGEDTLAWMAGIGNYLPGLDSAAMSNNKIRCVYGGQTVGPYPAYSNTRNAKASTRVLARLVTSFSQDYSTQCRAYLDAYDKLKQLPLVLVDDRNRWKMRLRTYLSDKYSDAVTKLTQKRCDDASGELLPPIKVDDVIFSFIGKEGNALRDEQVQALTDMIGGQYQVLRTSELPQAGGVKSTTSKVKEKASSLVGYYRLTDDKRGKVAGGYERIAAASLERSNGRAHVGLGLRCNLVRLGAAEYSCSSPRVHSIKSTLRRLYNDVTEFLECPELLLSSGEIVLVRKTELDEADWPDALVSFDAELAHIQKAMFPLVIWANLGDHVFAEYSIERFVRVLYYHRSRLCVAGSQLDRCAEFMFKFMSLCKQLQTSRDDTNSLLIQGDYSRFTTFKRGVEAEVSRLLPAIERCMVAMEQAFPLMKQLAGTEVWDTVEGQWYCDQMLARVKKKAYVRMRDLPELPQLPVKLEGEYFASLRAQGYLGAKRSPRKSKCRQMTLTSS